MDVLKAALKFWQDRWPSRQRYLIGVSGGVDSVVLLRGLLETGYRNLVVCHLDHGLRGKTSGADARWVAKLAQKLDLPFLTEKQKVREEATASGLSLETAGRRARHRFFAKAARQYRCYRILLAHHADDQAETVLMNLCRGSAGLSGMTAETRIQVPGVRSPLQVLRPLLTVSKAAIRETAASFRWRFREDASNAVSDVVRNRLRLEVLPLLDAIFQRPTATAINRAVSWTEAARSFLQESAMPWISQEKLRTAELTALAPVLRDTILAGWLRARQVPDLSTAVLARATAMLDPATGPARWNLPGNLFLRRRAGWIWVECVPTCGPEPD